MSSDPIPTDMTAIAESDDTNFTRNNLVAHMETLVLAIMKVMSMGIVVKDGVTRLGLLTEYGEGTCFIVGCPAKMCFVTCWTRRES